MNKIILEARIGVNSVSKPHVEENVTHGPLIGEVTEETAIVWFRAAKAGAVWVHWLAEGEDQAQGVCQRSIEVHVDPESDFTGRAHLTNLRPRTKYLLRVGTRTGSFKTPGDAAFSFVFGSCIGGQGYGRQEDGGFPIFSAMAALKPDFIHINGDCIYADDTIEVEGNRPWNKGVKYVPGEDGKDLPVATGLSSFRARYRYHLEDPVYAGFLANCPLFNTWDDHEIHDNWGGVEKGEAFEEDSTRWSSYKEAGERAFFEYHPFVGPRQEPRRLYRSARWGPHSELFILDTRTYRARHVAAEEGTTPQMAHMIGAAQLKWLLQALSASTATWKFIATSVPISWPTGWPHPEDTGYDGWSDGSSEIGGPEKELMAICEHVREEQIAGLVFLAGDVHFPYMLSYDPFNSGAPLFYEMGATPFHSLCLPPPPGDKPRDLSLNPTTLYAAGAFAAANFNFGHAQVDASGRLTLSLRDVKGEPLFSKSFEPPPAKKGLY